MPLDASGAQEAAFRKMLRDMSPIFWDTDIEQLDMDANHRYIIARLLNMGGMRGYFWVRDHYSPPAIVDALTHRRDIRPIQQNFMAEQYGVPRSALPKPALWR